MLPTREHALWNSRSLPSEKEMREIIESMIVQNPYDLPVTGYSLPQLIAVQQAERKAQEEIYEKEKARLATLTDAERSNEKVELGPVEYLELSTLFPALAFRNESLVKDVVQEWQLGEDNIHNDRGFFSQADGELTERLNKVWSPSFIEKAKQSCSKGCFLHHRKIQRGLEICHLAAQTHNDFLKSVLDLERRLLTATLRSAGYIQQIGEPDLRRDIRLQQKNFPNEPTIVTLGSKLVEYYSNIYPQSSSLENGLLGNSINGMGWRGTHETFEIGHYESAVFSPSQIKMSHDFHFAYDIQRVDRGWDTVICMFIMVGIKVAPKVTLLGDKPTQQVSLF